MKERRRTTPLDLRKDARCEGATGVPEDPRTNRITEAVIGCGMAVANTLGPGFLEKVYENALLVELRKNGWDVRQQHAIDVFYGEVCVGQFVADLIVEGCVLVELKAVRKRDKVHVAQCLNYLKATGLRICLLLNSGGQRLATKRIVY